MKLMVGLGNPGREYRETRHNVGFMVVDELQRRHALSWQSGPSQLADATVAKKYGEGGWMIAKPLTYMNRSGDAVAGLLRYYGVDPADLLVIYDEVDLPYRRMKALARGGPRVRGRGTGPGRAGVPPPAAGRPRRPGAAASRSRPAGSRA